MNTWCSSHSDAFVVKLVFVQLPFSDNWYSKRDLERERREYLDVDQEGDSSLPRTGPTKPNVDTDRLWRVGQIQRVGDPEQHSQTDRYHMSAMCGPGSTGAAA